MEKEISSGAMLGIVLIALAAIIGLGFGVFAIAKGTANDGIVQVQDNLGTVSQQQFQDYDQKVIAGTQVTSALKNFEGKAVSILVQTKALADGQSIASAGDHKLAPVVNLPYSAGGSTVTGGFLNYNAIMAKDANGTMTSTIAGGAAVGSATGSQPAKLTGALELTLQNGVYNTAYGFATDSNGAVQFDNSTAGVYKSGNAEYISSTAKFQANLITDKSGTIVGVVFRQL